jgi:hypothetical protein
MSAHFALRSAVPSQTDINQVLDETTILISIILFGDRSDFLQDCYVVLTQDARTIKPVRVRYDGQAARSSVWPKGPAYRGKIVAQFNYAELNPSGRTKISVFPADGGEVTFDLDFARIE